MHTVHPNPIFKAMPRTKMTTKRKLGTAEEQTSRYTLAGAFNTIKRQLKEDQIEGEWSVSDNPEFDVSTNIFKTRDGHSSWKVQMRITGSIITVIMTGRHAGAIIEAVKRHANKVTPKKQKKAKSKNVLSQGSSSPSSDAAAGTQRLSRSRSRQNLDSAEASNDNFMRNLDQGTLTVRDERWIFKAQHFVTAVHRKYGSDVKLTIANGGQCMAVLAEKRIRGEEKRATMNFWPSSGSFTLTGIKRMRDGAPYDFFHTTIKDGPDIFDDQLIDPNTQMGLGETNDSDDPELKLKETPGGSDAENEQEEGQLHFDEDPPLGKTGGVNVIAEDIDVEDPPDGGATKVLTDVEGPRAQFVHYLTRQLFAKVVKGFRGTEGAELKFKKLHAKQFIRKIMLEQYISHTSQPPTPEMSVTHGYLIDIKRVASQKIHKWFVGQVPKWVEQAVEMTKDIGPEESIFGTSVHMMTHMRKIIADSTQTIAGLKKMVDAQAKQIAQLQKATANTCPKLDRTAPLDKPATKGELEAVERKMRGMLHGQNKGDTEAIKTWMLKEVKFAVGPLDSMSRKIKMTQDVLDSEKDKRIEAQRILLLTRERVRKLEAAVEAAGGGGQEAVLRHMREQIRVLEDAQGGNQEITDDSLRTILMKLSPEIEVMIAQAVDKIMDERPREQTSAQRRLDFQEEGTALQLGYKPPQSSPQPSPKRVKTEDGRPGGRSRSGPNSDRSSRGGGAHGSSTNVASRAGASKGGSASLQLVEEPEEKLQFTQEVKPNPITRWGHIRQEYENVETALKWAGLVSGPGLNNDAGFTYDTIRTGAFSASALERMIIKRIGNQKNGAPLNHTKMNEAVTKLVGYLEALEKKHNRQSRPGTGNGRN